jgi:hypothetical protein
MLVFDPFKRISVEDALAHPWLAALHDETDEPVADEPFNFEVSGHLPPAAAAQLMWSEVLRFHPEIAGPVTAAAAPAVAADEDQQKADSSDIHVQQAVKSGIVCGDCDNNSDLIAAEDQATLNSNVEAAVDCLGALALSAP